MNPIQYGTALTGSVVSLVPLEAHHLPELDSVARDQRIWQFYPYDMSISENRVAKFIHAIVERERGTQYPFVIVHRSSNTIIGSTRLMDIQLKDDKLEIGWTWLHPDYWATSVNPECKLLLLTYCFEVLEAARVQFKTDENNLRSRAAIGKIGGQFEGILRADIKRDNGTYRSSAYFSILKSEWHHVKPALIKLFESTNQQ